MTPPRTTPHPDGDAPHAAAWEVRDGLWAISVPLAVRTLGHTLVYALMTDEGVHLVDVGWNADDAFEAVEAGLQASGRRMSDIVSIVATHVHPDHYGLAARIDAPVRRMHPAEADLVSVWYDRAAGNPMLGDRQTLSALGVPDDELAAIAGARMPGPDPGPAPPATDTIADGEVLELGPWRLVARWTPGHSPGHLAFAMPEQRLLISGDHVLPSLSPPIIYHPRSGDDPLGAFLAALTRVDVDDVDLVLPGHERPFTGLRARVAELRRWHLDRVRRVQAAMGGTAWEIAQRIARRRPWPEMRLTAQRLAVQETAACLHLLERRGIAARSGSAPYVWEARADGLALDRVI